MSRKRSSSSSRLSKLEQERKYGPWAYRAWGYGLPCVVVGCTTTDRRPGAVKIMECCHSRTGGMARKARWQGNTFFACWRHHDESGRGVRTFEERYELAVNGVRVQTLHEAAGETLRQWFAREDGLAF